MKLEKFTVFMICAGVAFILLTIAIDSPGAGLAPEEPIVTALKCIGAAPIFFFAAVVEFLARIARSLEGAVDAVEKEEKL